MVLINFADSTNTLPTDLQLWSWFKRQDFSVVYFYGSVNEAFWVLRSLLHNFINGWIDKHSSKSADSVECLLTPVWLPGKMQKIHCVSLKKTTPMLHTVVYNFNAHQLILVIFSRDVDGRVSYQIVVPPLLNNVPALPGETWTLEIVFSVMLYTVSRKRHCFGLLYLRHALTNFNNFL